MTTLDIKARFKRFTANPQTRGFIFSVIIMAIISFLFFYPDNIEGNDLRQHDMMQGLANGHEIEQYQHDTGHKSWWTNSLFGGMPAFQISPSYSSNSLFSWVTKVYGLGLPAPSNLLFMMMLGFMILMMAMRINWRYGLIGAIAWGLSSYFVIIIGAGHIWKFVTLAYIPPTIGGIIMAYRGRVLSGGALAAFFTMMQLQANHIQMTYYFGFVIFALIAAYLVSAIRHHTLKRWLRATATLIVAALLGILANLPNIYHTSRYAKETQRVASELTDPGAGGVDKEYITKYSYGISETMTLMIPDVKGGATVKPYKGQTPPPLLDMASVVNSKDPYLNYYLQQFPQYFGEPESTNGPVYVGVIIVALFLLGAIIVKGALKWALVAATILSIALAWGRNFMGLTDLFIDLVPMYSQFRTPESILVIAQFTMPMLGIMGLYTLFKSIPEGKPTRIETQRLIKPVYISFGIVIFFCLIGCLMPSFYGLDDIRSRNLLDISLTQPDLASVYHSLIEGRASMVRADSLRSLIFVLMAGGMIWLYINQRIRNGVIVTASLALLVTVDLYTVDKRYLDHDSFVKVNNAYSFGKKAIEPTPADQEIMRDTDPDFRVMDLDRFAEATPSYFHKTIGGYHAAKLGRYQDMLERHITQLQTETDFEILNMLNTKYFIQQGQVIPNPDAMGNAWFVDAVRYVDGANAEMEALDNIDLRNEAVADRRFADELGTVRPHVPGDTVMLTSYAPDRLTYLAKSANGGTVVFSEIYYPWGWKATIDGNPLPIARVNYLLRGVSIPSGEHEIIMTFDPDSVKTTTTVATIAVIAIYVWIIALIITLLYRTHKKPQSSGTKQ